MKQLETDFNSREALTDYIRQELGGIVAESDTQVSPFKGSRIAAEERVNAIEAKAYVRSRNFYSGKVTRLSPYIRHGVITQEQVRRAALSDAPAQEVEKFIQEITWRSFWQHVYANHPNWVWENVEEYKTGFTHEDYADELPEDIRSASTESAAINHFIRDLIDTGYMHNHTRMYVASYVVHFRRVKWQAGAQFFLEHLVDGDVASNNLSWQWVASTFSRKPYIFNLENLQKYCGDAVDCSAEQNTLFDASYEELNRRLFPKKESV